MWRSSAIELLLGSSSYRAQQGHAAKVSRQPLGEPTDPESGAAEDLAQFALGALEHALLPLGEVLAGAVDVKGQHRHRRLVGRALAPLAGFSRTLQRQRDLVRVAVGEHAFLEIECIAAPGHLARPALVCSGPRHVPATARNWRKFPDFRRVASPRGDVEKRALVGSALAEVGVAVRAQDVDGAPERLVVGALAGYQHDPRQHL